MRAAITIVARQTKKHAAELNLFEDETSRSDPFHLRTAIISTRVYIVLLTVAVIILVVFAALGTQSEVITERNPSQASYEDLLKKTAAPLLCPCRHVTIPYVNLSRTTVEYHPVCSSVFVSDDWINHLFSPNVGHLYQGDFRASASSLFQLLAAFCLHANRSVHDALDNFHSETLLSPNILSSDSFEAQVQVKSKFLQSSTANNVCQLLQLVRSTTHANELLTALRTSKGLSVQKGLDGDTLRLVVAHVSFLYEDSTECKCASSANCSVPSGFFDIASRQVSQFITAFLYVKPLGNVTGFFVGCYAVESLLLSTLECLFDASCLETIRKFIPSSNITGVSALNASQTRFAPNTSIETIINDLFIEKWSTEQFFSDYFKQCAPILCTYTLKQRNNALYVLTKLLGLYGGLTATLRLCVPLIIAWWRKRRVIASAESRSSEYLYLKSHHIVLLKLQNLYNSPAHQ